MSDALQALNAVPLLLEILRRLPQLARMFGRPVIRIEMRRPYTLSDAREDYDHSRRIVPGDVVNAGTGVAKNCWLQLISIVDAEDGSIEAGSAPIKWGDQRGEEVEFRDIQPGAQLPFVMAWTPEPWRPSPSKQAPLLGEWWKVEIARRDEGAPILVAMPIYKGTYEVKLVVVGDSFRMKPYSYCVRLDENGLNVLKPLGLWSRYVTRRARSTGW